MTTKAMTTKIQPQDMAAYLDTLKPIMDKLIQCKSVKLFGEGNPKEVIGVDRIQCLVKIRVVAGITEWIRVEQIEYIYPY